MGRTADAFLTLRRSPATEARFVRHRGRDPADLLRVYGATLSRLGHRSRDGVRRRTVGEVPGAPTDEGPSKYASPVDDKRRRSVRCVAMDPRLKRNSIGHARLEPAVRQDGYPLARTLGPFDRADALMGDHDHDLQRGVYSRLQAVTQLLELVRTEGSTVVAEEDHHDDGAPVVRE